MARVHVVKRDARGPPIVDRRCQSLSYLLDLQRLAKCGLDMSCTGKCRESNGRSATGTKAATWTNAHSDRVTQSRAIAHNELGRPRNDATPCASRPNPAPSSPEAAAASPQARQADSAARLNSHQHTTQDGTPIAHRRRQWARSGADAASRTQILEPLID